MKKITFEEFKSLMAFGINNKTACIEVLFCVDNSDVYQSSWLGKKLSLDTNNVIYWFGLTEDGSQAYDFDSFEEFVNEKVFYGKSLKEIWPLVSMESIDRYI